MMSASRLLSSDSIEHVSAMANTQENIQCQRSTRLSPTARSHASDSPPLYASAQPVCILR